MARGATVGAYDEADEDASGDGLAPRWGFRLLGVSVVALTGVVGAISLDLYRHAHPDLPLFDLSRIVGGFGLPESFVDRGLNDDLHVGSGSAEITLSIAPVAAPPAPAAPPRLEPPAPVAAAAPIAASAPSAAPSPGMAAAPPPPAAEPVMAAAPPVVPAPVVAPSLAAEAPAVAMLASVTSDPDPAPEPLATRAALAAVADLRRPVLPSAKVAPAEPENQPTDLPDPLAVRHSLTVAAAVAPAVIETLNPVATVSATSLGAVSPVKATAYLDEARSPPPPAAPPPAPAADSSGGFEIAELPSIFAGLSSISAQAAETSAGLDEMVPPPAPADLIVPGGMAAAGAPVGGNPGAASRPPARGIIFAVEATRLADVVAHGTDRRDPVASVVENASLAAVPMDDDAASGIPTVSSSYIVTPAASLLRAPVDPADVTDVDSRGRGLSACEEGDDACRAFVAAEDGALLLPSPVLARYGRDPVVIGGMELSTDPVELERALRCLSFIAYGEAGNQGPRGMAAVIWVIMNRVVQGDVFAPGPCEVIAQTGQFEPMTLGRYDDIADTIKAGGMPPFLNSRGAERILQRTARLVVWQMMDGYFADDPTVGAQYFLAPAAMRALGRSLPDWTNRFTMTAAIGDHNFYRRDGL